jgi:hypothetical protein
MMKIGRWRPCNGIADEYRSIALADEEAARVLQRSGQSRPAMYFWVQAMEKHVRAKIFTLVNPNLEWVRKKNRSHSLEDAIEFLLEIITTDAAIREQVRIQLCKQVLGGIRFAQLHNDLRYPFYSPEQSSFSVLEVEERDAKLLATQLDGLKKCLRDLDRLR